MSGSRNYGLDVARAFAISLVLLTHARIFFRDYFPDIVYYGESGAQFGVDLFFALSGYLIGGIILRDLGSTFWGGGLCRFFLRRWFRTLPNYAFWTAIYILWFIADNGYSNELLRFILFFQDMPYGQARLPFSVTWSLAVEEWFYLSSAPVFLILRSLKLTPEKAAVSMALGYIMMAFICKIYGVMAYGEYHPYIYKGTLPRIDAVMFGVLMVILERYKRDYVARHAKLGALIGFSVLLCMVLWIEYGNHNTLIYCIIVPSIVPAGFAIILPWMKRLQPSESLPPFLQKCIVGTSLISYSLYLCQELPLRLIYKLLNSFGGASDGKMALLMSSLVWCWISCIAWLILTFTTAIISYLIIEKTGLRIRDRVCP